MAALHGRSADSGFDSVRKTTSLRKEDEELLISMVLRIGD